MVQYLLKIVKISYNHFRPLTEMRYCSHCISKRCPLKGTLCASHIAPPSRLQVYTELKCGFLGENLVPHKYYGFGSPLSHFTHKQL